MRCSYGPKGIKKLERKTGLKIKYALCRGNTGHRVDIKAADGRCYNLWPDGTLELDRDFTPKNILTTSISEVVE